MKKPTKKQVKELREGKAYQVAAETVLFMQVDKRPIAVNVNPNLGYYSVAYTSVDFRMTILRTIGFVASAMLRDNREIDTEGAYNAMLSFDDPDCLLDRITVDELRDLITLALHLLTTNWYIVESIATKLLSYAQDELAVVSFSPAGYSFTQ